MYRASASRVRMTDSTFGAAAISLSMAASRWCRVPTCVDVRREETLCPRGGGPNRGVGIATASEPTAASGAGNHRRTYASPNTRICAEIKRMAAAAAACAAAAWESADGEGAG